MLTRDQVRRYRELLLFKILGIVLEGEIQEMGRLWGLMDEPQRTVFRDAELGMLNLFEEGHLEYVTIQAAEDI